MGCFLITAMPYRKLHGRVGDKDICIFSSASLNMAYSAVATWIFTYTLLVFSSEIVYRSVTRTRLRENRRTSLLVGFGIIISMLLLTWIPSKIRQHKRNKCFTSLMLLIVKWSDFATVLTSGLILLYITNAIILIVRLIRTSKLDHQQRIEMSSMVYYLASSFVILVGNHKKG